MTGLSNYVGEAPNSCVRSGADQACEWRAIRRTPGYEDLARIAGVRRKKVRLLCILPFDGSPRDPDSCRVLVGGF